MTVCIFCNICLYSTALSVLGESFLYLFSILCEKICKLNVTVNSFTKIMKWYVKYCSLFKYLNRQIYSNCNFHISWQVTSCSNLSIDLVKQKYCCVISPFSQHEQARFCSWKYWVTMIACLVFFFFSVKNIIGIMMIWTFKANNFNLIESCSLPLDFQKQSFQKSHIYFF